MSKDLFSVFNANKGPKVNDQKLIKKIHKLDESNEKELASPSKKVHTNDTNGKNENK